MANSKKPDPTEGNLATYLGDGAYVEWNGYAFVVYTSNGIARTNVIYLEPPHMSLLARFVQEVIK